MVETVPSLFYLLDCDKPKQIILSLMPNHFCLTNYRVLDLLLLAHYHLIISKMNFLFPLLHLFTLIIHFLLNFHLSLLLVDHCLKLTFFQHFLIQEVKGIVMILKNLSFYRVFLLIKAMLNFHHHHYTSVPDYCYLSCFNFIF